jgi:hypothetical protein
MTNKAKYIFITSLIGIFGLISLQACDLRSFVKVDAPKEVLEATDTTPPVTLKNASAVREDWVFYVESNTKKLDSSIEDAEATYATIHQIVSIGIDTAGQASNSIPYGGILFGALTGLTGLMLPQPKIVRKKE